VITSVPAIDPAACQFEVKTIPSTKVSMLPSMRQLTALANDRGCDSFPRNRNTQISNIRRTASMCCGPVSARKSLGGESRSTADGNKSYQAQHARERKIGADEHQATIFRQRLGEYRRQSAA